VLKRPDVWPHKPLSYSIQMMGFELGVIYIYIYIYNTNYINFVETIVYLGLVNPVAARSKAYVCDRSLGGIVGSNFAGGWTSVSVNVLCCDGQILHPEESDRVWCVYECH